MRSTVYYGYMVNRFVQFLAVLFPPRPDQVTVSNTHPCAALCQPGCVDGVWYAASYQDPRIKAAILENKFYRNARAAQLLSYTLESFITQKNLSNAVFLPVPLSNKRFRARGHNQTSTILRSCQPKVFVIDSILQRVRDTPPQMKRERAKRLTNMTGAFAVNSTQAEILSKTQTIVLVDDVVTTGTTLKEAVTILKKHFPNHKILCLAIAH